jgi:putative SOS response-associated peptidase YedK
MTAGTPGPQSTLRYRDTLRWTHAPLRRLQGAPKEALTCGRFVQFSAPEVYASAFALDGLCEARPRFNIAPTRAALAFTVAEAGGRASVALRWGLVPLWSQGPDNCNSMINPRAGTFSTKPAYRNACKYQRCLIPAEGFYEWQAGQGGKTPFLIRCKDNAPFAISGL